MRVPPVIRFAMPVPLRNTLLLLYCSGSVGVAPWMTLWGGCMARRQIVDDDDDDGSDYCCCRGGRALYLCTAVVWLWRVLVSWLSVAVMMPLLHPLPCILNPLIIHKFSSQNILINYPNTLFLLVYLLVSGYHLKYCLDVWRKHMVRSLVPSSCDGVFSIFFPLLLACSSCTHSSLVTHTYCPDI